MTFDTIAIRPDPGLAMEAALTSYEISRSGLYGGASLIHNAKVFQRLF